MDISNKEGNTFEEPIGQSKDDRVQAHFQGLPIVKQNKFL